MTNNFRCAFNSKEITKIKESLRASPNFREGLQIEQFGGVSFVHPKATGNETVLIYREAMELLIKNLNASYEKTCFIVGESKDGVTDLTKCFPVDDDTAPKSSNRLYTSDKAYWLALKGIKNEISLHKPVTIVDIHSHPSTIDSLRDADSEEKKSILRTISYTLEKDRHLKLGYSPEQPCEFSRGDVAHASVIEYFSYTHNFNQYLFGIVRFYDLIEGGDEKRFARLVIYNNSEFNYRKWDSYTPKEVNFKLVNAEGTKVKLKK